ncbi:unnamed protein product, partial [Ectocarpus sp. 13 AM-2016]
HGHHDNKTVGECLEWTNHCHASDSGSAKSMWKFMRVHAQPSLQARRRRPVASRRLARATQPTALGGAATKSSSSTQNSSRSSGSSRSSNAVGAKYRTPK